MSFIIIEFNEERLPEEMMLLDEENNFHHWRSTPTQEAVFQLCSILRGFGLLFCTTVEEHDFLKLHMKGFQTKIRIATITMKHPIDNYVNEEKHLINQRINGWKLETKKQFFEDCDGPDYCFCCFLIDLKNLLKPLMNEL